MLKATKPLTCLFLDAVLKVDGKVMATQKMERTIPIILQWDETFDVGVDTRTPVGEKDYQVPFRFTGKIAKLTFKLGPEQLGLEEKKIIQDKNGKRD